jgi:hypothetical protein
MNFPAPVRTLTGTLFQKTTFIRRSRRRGGVQLSARWRDRLHVTRTVAPAVVIAFVIDLMLTRATFSGFFGLLTAYLFLFLVYFFVGRWIGKHLWPQRGQAIARTLLRRRIKRKHEFVFVCDRPDRSFTTLRRVWEVVGFAAGLSVILSTLLTLIGLTPTSLLVSAIVLPLILPMVITALSFVLVPYWLFARLGFRIVDPVRWLILPLSRGYADRLKLSNGALILLATGGVFNLAFRAGQSNAAAIATALTLVLRVVAVVVVVAATAVAYYLREERRVAHELELGSLTLGIRDGRGMTDGDFLPRLPTQKSP